MEKTLHEIAHKVVEIIVALNAANPSLLWVLAIVALVSFVYANYLLGKSKLIGLAAFPAVAALIVWLFVLVKVFVILGVGGFWPLAIPFGAMLLGGIPGTIAKGR